MYNGIVYHTSRECYNELENWLVTQIREAQQNMEVSGAITDLETLAKQRHIHDINWNAEIEDHGEIIPKGNGWNCSVKSDLPYFHKRFVVGHEISHTFFFEFLPKKTPERKYLNATLEDEERLCDRGAIEILIPPPILERELKDYCNIDLSIISEVSRKFNVPDEITANQFLELGLMGGVIICSEIYETSKSLHGAKLRVRWHAGKSQLYLSENQRTAKIFPPFIPRGILKSHLTEALENKNQLITNEKAQLGVYGKNRHLADYQLQSFCVQEQMDLPFEEYIFNSSTILTNIKRLN